MSEDRDLSRAEALYHAALERPEADREGFLSRSCGDDEELLREVRSLLGYHAEAKKLLSRPVADAETRRRAFVRGARLGHYEILDQLGAGGMGEVFRARDGRLGREVAIKVLPDRFARDPERLARFEREARALAALNHAGIAAVHGFEEIDGTRLLVMELVPGQTLADQISRAPIAVPEALGLCAQIADALSAAHEKGILHRDLKPSNVNITPGGRAKLLDFGLAKELGGASTDPSASDEASLLTTASSDPAPRERPPATAEGVIQGTAAYMSPEQVRGESLDVRSDVWAFGCVLFEVLTGQRAFRGRTGSDILSAVLEREPGLHLLPPSTPGPVVALLERCLQKDRTRRLRDIADARLELEQILEASAGVTPGFRESGGGTSLPRGQRGMVAAQFRGCAVQAAWVLVAAVALGVLSLSYNLSGPEALPAGVPTPGPDQVYAAGEVDAHPVPTREDILDGAAIARLEPGQSVSVTVSYVVSADGRVTDAEIVESGTEALDAALLEAISSWEYQPAHIGGWPVKFRYLREFTYRSD